ncbi:AsmA family protein [Acidimangrovimonas pyrenivorans]|uniref:AsmA-like C-terminal region-containing protein n=1 Tax=Acidimangrovimonas pyrenivorans TaxID=2030798 RepID=A0ABV7ADL9_9RHOB
MNETQPAEPRARPARRRRGRFGLWLLLSLALLVAAGGFGVLAVTGRPLVAPDWAVQRVQARLNQVLQGRGRISLGSAAVVIDSNYLPRVRLRDVRFLDSTGNAVAALPELRVTLALEPLLKGQIRPVRLRVSGASLTLRRDASGGFNLALGSDMGGDRPPVGSLSQLLDAIDGVFAQPELASLRRIDADALSLTLIDNRVGRTWEVSDGRATLVQDPRKISIELGFGLAGGAEEPARAVLTFVSQKGSPAARIAARVEGVAARDIAVQSPALAWLKLLEAPISGDLRASIDGAGQIGTLEGALQIGKGALIPGAAVRPVAFNKGSLYFTYDPRAEKISFSEATVDSKVLRIHASGHAYLEDLENGLPRGFLAQVKFEKVMVDPEGLFQEPVRFSQGALDLRLRLDPFEVTVGQLALIEGDRRIDSHGSMRATPKGLAVSLDTTVNAIRHDRLVALWPVGLVPNTRQWVDENVQTGVLSNVKSALRIQPGQKPHLALGYDFSNADVRVIKTLPPVEGGRGYATIDGDTYTMVIEEGHVTPPRGGVVDVAGSVFQVPDITLKPAPAVVHLKTDSSVTAALSLLDEPPFEFLTKAGQPVDISGGHARVEATIRLPLVPKIELPDVTYTVSGEISDVRSTKIVPGKVLTADLLHLHADNSGIEIAGAAHLGKVGFHGRWTQGFGPEAKGRSQVSGLVELSQNFIDEFGIGLPKGAVAGSGVGDLTIDLRKDEAPRFSLVSDLNRLALKIPEIGWSKPHATLGKLEVAGQLSSPPKIEKLRLSAPGLSAAGRVELNKDGSLRAVRLARVQVGGWFDGPVDLLGRGKGRAVGIAIGGGSLNMAKSNFGAGAAQGEAVPITAKLDRLRISDSLSLTGVDGNFTTAGGFNGTFSGLVNGKAAISGTVAPASNKRGARSAVRITAKDAGAVFAAAGIFTKAHGGSLTMTLRPRAEPQQYDGHLAVTRLRVRDAPALADLLGAISVVGLLEQLSGDGIAFSNVDGDFRLTPKAIEVTRGAAVGASLGVSMAGLYTFDDEKLDMQGVVSPVYLLNAIGGVVSPRRGEGLFGFNYRLRGTADDPQISVNPLSILTPGLFRDIFRRPLPKLPE